MGSIPRQYKFRALAIFLGVRNRPSYHFSVQNGIQPIIEKLINFYKSLFPSNRRGIWAKKAQCVFNQKKDLPMIHLTFYHQFPQISALCNITLISWYCALLLGIHDMIPYNIHHKGTDSTEKVRAYSFYFSLGQYLYSVVFEVYAIMYTSPEVFPNGPSHCQYNFEIWAIFRCTQ